ncbi:MAG: RNA methyltransferase [Ruminococcaceae bacterium]|nr:RNA methyltransferase [Oscillospiraceae bacterium]
MKKITSRDNRKVTETKKLLKKSYREKTGLFLLEGERLVFDALKKGVALQWVFARHEYFEQGMTALECFETEDNILSHMSDTCNSQGIIAVAKKPEAELGSLDKQKPVAVCDGLRDPGNLGTIIRTADAAGFGGVILLGDCVDVYSPKVVRSTMGALFDLPIVKAENVEQLSDFRLVCADLQDSVSLYDFDFSEPFALVVGNEAHGVSKAVLEAAQEKIKIPMVGQSESLNAAVAFGVAAYEAFRQRNY